jgi:hypothetical protein
LFLQDVEIPERDKNSTGLRWVRRETGEGKGAWKVKDKRLKKDDESENDANEETLEFLPWFEQWIYVIDFKTTPF